jgi:hypothetical protein
LFQYEKGLDLVDGPQCPLCDTPWEDEQRLREHLKAKLTKSEEARKLQGSLRNTGKWKQGRFTKDTKETPRSRRFFKRLAHSDLKAVIGSTEAARRAGR